MDLMIMPVEITDADVLKLVELVKSGVREAVGTLIVEFGSFSHADDVEIRSLEQMADFYRKKL
jgi:fructose-bisphosphate aldolase class II